MTIQRCRFFARICAAAFAVNCIAGRPAAAQTVGEARMNRRLDSIRGDSVRLLDFLRRMPKGADLHNHLSGAIRPESWAIWAAQDGLCFAVAAATLTPPPCDGVDRIPAARFATDTALRAEAIGAWSMRGWRPGGSESGADHFFATFSKTSAIGLSHLGDMLAEATSRAAAEGVTYLELMINPDNGSLPMLGGRVGWTTDFVAFRDQLEQAGLRDSIRSASRILDSAEVRERQLLQCGTAHADPGCAVTVRYIYQVIRSRPPQFVFAQILGGLEWPAIDPRFVSLNLVAPEHGDVAVHDFDLQMHMLDFLRTAHADVPITLHAGELSPQVAPRDAMRTHIRESVEVGGAKRIGHGVDVLEERDSESLMREMAARHILVEIALTSNAVILGVTGKQHPLGAYLAHGVPVALVTDDEGVSQSDMTHEYYRAVVDQGLDYRALKSMARNSIIYSFAPDSTKVRVGAELDSALARFERP